MDRPVSASLRAGAAAREITPTSPAFLVGYPHVPRVSEGVHDPLWAAALYLNDGESELLLIGLDILFITRETARACRRSIAERTGIPEGNILISASHTHSGPVTREQPFWRHDSVASPPDPGYMARFESQIVAAGIAAKANAEPACLAVTMADATGVGGNRLTKNGVADPEVGILAVRRARDHSFLAVDLVYSMHPTVIHEDTRLVTADFPGYARARIGGRLGNPTVIYHTGPAGDQSPRYHVVGQTFAEAERLGSRLGDAVVAAVESLPADSFSDRVRLGAAREIVSLPLRQFLPVTEAEAALRNATETFERLRREGAPHGPVRTAECVVFGAEEALRFARARTDNRFEQWCAGRTDAEVQVLRIGDACWVGLPGELFVEYGLEIKRRSPLRTFVVSLANGELQGYIVTPAAAQAGGYEAAAGIFRPEAGAVMVEAALRLVGRMAQAEPASFVQDRSDR